MFIFSIRIDYHLHAVSGDDRSCIGINLLQDCNEYHGLQKGEEVDRYPSFSDIMALPFNYSYTVCQPRQFSLKLHPE